MNRLATVLPEWTRVIWTTPAARAKWEEIIQNISRSWTRIERWAVVDGARESCLTFTEPQHLPEIARWATGHGLLVLPIAQVGLSDQYSATPVPIAPGRPWQYRIVICRPELRDAWFHAWEGGTKNEVIGQLLGFPDCCRRFFERVWVDEKYLDTTWPMAVNGGYALGTETEALFEAVGLHQVKVGGFDACNILWRWMGVRAVTHLPCSFNCPETVKVANMFRQVANDREFGKWMDLADEILSWPIEWSALHGIAEIKTPILKVSSRTDLTAEKYVVQREGSSYPLEGASGISFPYQNRQRVAVTKGAAHARAFDQELTKLSVPIAAPITVIDSEGPVEFGPLSKLEAALGVKKEPVVVKSDIEIVKGPTADLWLDNGFVSLEAMNRSHDVLLEAARIETLHDGAEILDLGCGNGRLLERLGARVEGLELYGIEADPAKCRRAGVRYQNRGLTIYQGSIFDPEVWTELRPDLVFFMPGRLLEKPAGFASNDTLRGLLRLCERAVFYAYGDWLKNGGILDLLNKTELGRGWEKVGTVVRSPHVEAILALRR